MVFNMEGCHHEMNWILQIEMITVILNLEYNVSLPLNKETYNDDIHIL